VSGRPLARSPVCLLFVFMCVARAGACSTNLFARGEISQWDYAHRLSIHDLFEPVLMDTQSADPINFSPTLLTVGDVFAVCTIFRY
jgi:hypothetical protein